MKKEIIIGGAIILLALGWFFIIKPEPPFGGTMDVKLEWLYSYEDIKYSTISGYLEPGNYVYLPISGNTNHLLSAGDYLVNDNGKIYRTYDKPTLMTAVTAIGEWSFNVFKDPQTGDIVKEEISKSTYTSLGTKDAAPATKTITKTVGFWDIFGIKTVYADISRLDTPVTDYSSSATSRTFAYNSGSATNRVLVVTVATPGACSGVTYNGTALTLKVESHAQIAWTQIFALDDPTSGSNNVVVQGGSGWFVDSVAISYDGADTIGDVGDANANASNPTIINLTTTAANSFVVDHLQHNTTITVGGSQSQIYNHVSTGTQNDGVSDVKVITSGTNQQVTWTGNAAYYDYVAVEVKWDGIATTTKARRLIIE